MGPFTYYVSTFLGFFDPPLVSNFTLKCQHISEIFDPPPPPQGADVICERPLMHNATFAWSLATWGARGWDGGLEMWLTVWRVPLLAEVPQLYGNSYMYTCIDT